jgi:hypothetical protein
MKSNRDKRREKIKKFNEKLKEKEETLKILNKEREKNLKKLAIKIEKATLRKEEILKQREVDKLALRKKRKEFFLKNQINKREIQNLEYNKRESILQNESCRFERQKWRRKNNKNSVNRLGNKTFQIFQENYKLRKNFLKDLNRLVSQSVSKKTEKERRKLYINKLREEAEKRRKEQEELMDKL